MPRSEENSVLLMELSSAASLAVRLAALLNEGLDGLRRPGFFRSRELPTLETALMSFLEMAVVADEISPALKAGRVVETGLALDIKLSVEGRGGSSGRVWLSPSLVTSEPALSLELMVAH